ncbi:phosphoglycerate dehydrogenase-like enzyme [Sediminihabitans luteus]|uniref:Phosphoglycerate dehydrogenase-like enzyme n=1 Tax=Sediminihabitans luteus TaxID=1138585 RepID=A0A2M9CPJ9_9CELL|nr:NAD(P)-dependent oxidoreductase [Sediminihabitans luteus]PJJ73820.1 phosphoglycerate dehydrogenase-like enzyme [Sediminihabitans luteus]GIJ00497.1 phosphoglycerate dehydrogenase [Sediminihabitans luteus]
MKILVPATLAPDLQARPDDVVVPYDGDAPIADEHTDADVLVVWAAPPPFLQDAAQRLGALRLVQTLAAGPDAVLAAGFAPSVTVANGRGLHDGPVAEHTLALLLAAVRRLDRLGAAQREHRWDSALGHEQAGPDAPHYTLDGARVTVWGFGSIAARLAPVLALLGAEVTGVARSAGARDGVRVVTETDLPALLPATDVLISLLPATPRTRHALDAARLALLPAHAVLVNVGRGSTVDEAALVDALRAGRLGAAALDVTDTEPLRDGSPLWDAPRTIITPHVAGGRPQGASALVEAQVEALHAGTPLRNVVER